jgi:hypothetical protein
MPVLWMAAALAAAGSHPAAKAATSPVGVYRLQGGPDSASEIALTPDGRFRFWLIEGALDARAEGRRTANGTTLRLVTIPKPVPPAFTPSGRARTGEAPLSVRVTWPDGRGIALVDLRVGFDDGPPVIGYTQEEGWTLPAEEKRAPRWVELGLDMYGVGYTRFAVDAAQANALSFALTPNGLGVLDFSTVDVKIAPGALLLSRGGGGVGRYVRKGR